MKDKRKFPVILLIILFFLAATGYISSCKGKEGVSEKMSSLKKLPGIKQRLAKYAPTEITFDRTILNDEQHQVLKNLVQAARYIDDIFWKQAYAKGLAFKKALEESTDPVDKDYLRFLKINFGPFDRQDGNRPFLGSEEKPPGAGFYPPDMSKEEFQAYIAQHPELKDEFENPYRVIKRKNGELVTVPYNEEYREYLEPAARYLKEAARLTSNPSLKKYLMQRAEDLLRNDYYESDCLWIDLKDNLLEIVIGPFEVYEDALMGLKAAYESFVYINDLEEMKKIKGYLDYLQEMQKNLPVEQKYKDQEVSGLKSPLNVVIEVFTAGDTKAGIQTLAFVLPNDERVREEKGTKKVFLKNVMKAKFDKILIPISEKVLSKQDAGNVTFYAYFNEVILHEISHALGVNYVKLPDGTKTTVNKALRELYSAIEEAKATVVGLYNIHLLMEKGWIPPEKEKEIYATYLAGMFRTLRFGTSEAHGLSTLIQFNFLRKKEAFLYDHDSEKFYVNTDTIRGAIQELAAKLLILEGEGDYSMTKEFISHYSGLDELAQKIIQKLEDIPVDIEPVFLIQ